jgi:type IV pilus assembly protein PilY1
MNNNALLKLGTGILAAMVAATSWSFTPSTQPPESTAVPGNVLLALSVEYPTGLQVSYTQAYSSVIRYDGYFDNRKCYTYNGISEIFSPISAASATATCGTDEWGGNLLNWLTMTNLDQFRSVMTGGTRDDFSRVATRDTNPVPGDTTSRTILIRAFSDRNEYNPTKTLPTGATAPVPTAFRGATVRSGGYGSKFIVSNTGFDNMSAEQQRQSCSEHPGINRLMCLNIRVEACLQIPATGTPVVSREANCQAKYTGVAKPEGLIQEYAGALRFGAFGYLNQTGNERSGGVLRSAMKSVGPVAATSTGVTANARKEWNESSGIIFGNPDPADATASGVTNSGLMNYLNKFGYTAGYKGNDPVSELYHAALLYLRGHAPPAAYTDMTGATAAQIVQYRDGFPVITGAAHQRGGSRDPMINSCQKNFVLALGDIYTHCDGNLPGSTKAGCTGGTPIDPNGLNVQNLWNTTRGMEGLTDNGWVGGASNATPYIAGLAHWANTNDIRSDLTGTQTVSTYVVDVLENGNGVGGWPAAGTVKSQYWLAAKYGGFDTTIAGSTNPNISSTSWDKNGNGVPDTWFAGSTPALLKAGLSSAFADIATKSSANSASSAAVTSSRQTSNSQIIYAGYNPKDWSGTVSACTPTQTAAECALTPVWEASKWFDTTTTSTFVTTPLTPTTRKIFTSWPDATGFSSMPFQWSSLTTTQQALLNATDSLGSARLSYLRGARTNEGSLFRSRPPTLLGDIVNSGVTYVGGSGPALTGPRYPGHSAYRGSTKNRPAVVYVGANDGMLHAFSGVNGKELFGYVPSAVFANLPGLSALNFQHRYFVDSTPMAGDFQKSATTWGTMLVGGLGAGGKGYYALDISGQSTFAAATESTLSAIPMWEFTAAQDSDLGYTFNEPSIDPVTGAYRQIAKVADATVADGVWRVIVGNGYGSAGQDAILFMLNANTGTPDVKLTTGNTTDNGLSSPTPVDTNRDGLIDTVYAGDALGNMHKFQFSKASGIDFVLAKHGETGAAWRYIGRVFASGEPITTAPSVAPSCDGIGWNVAFGSGKLNEDVDYNDTARRGFYTVVDKGPSSAMTVSATALTEITYSSTSLTGGKVVRNWSTPNLTGQRGWKMFFNGGERVLTNSTLPPDTGAVLFGTTKPSGDVCTPGNSGFIMAVNMCSGTIGNLLVDGVLVGGLAIDSTGVVKVSNTYVSPDKKPVVVCNQGDCKEGDNPLTFSVPEAPRGRYTWREILTK